MSKTKPEHFLMQPVAFLCQFGLFDPSTDPSFHSPLLQLKIFFRKPIKTNFENLPEHKCIMFIAIEIVWLSVLPVTISNNFSRVNIVPRSKDRTAFFKLLRYSEVNIPFCRQIFHSCVLNEIDDFTIQMF